ncbi:MAG: antitoxin family protein [Blastocatellia bacterium]|nr:antitoxin family protein [Blastocatellia bacterium]
MSITIEAVYEAGVFKPLTPSTDFKEGETVRLVVEPVSLIEIQRRNRIVIEPDVAREIIDSAEFGIVES